MSYDNIQNDSSRPWALFYKQAKNNLEEMNTNLLKHLETLDNENYKLKNVIQELCNEIKEKDISLEESCRIISKLNEEYSRVIKDFKSLEKNNMELEMENKDQRKQLELTRKSNITIEKSNKQIESYKNELDTLRNEMKLVKSNLTEKVNEMNKKDKDITEKGNLILEMKNKIEYLESLNKEQSKSLQEKEIKVNELTKSVSNKEEELKLLTQFSKDLGNENKSNVDELIDQAINTIKVFYNTISNNNNTLVIPGGGCSNENIEGINIITKQELLKLLKEQKVSYLLEEAITNNDDKLMSNSIIKDNIKMKYDLIKCELYSNLLREFNLVAYLNSTVPKECMNLTDLIQSFVDEYCKLKNLYQETKVNLEQLNSDYKQLHENKTELDLCILNIKDNMRLNYDKFKEKFQEVESAYLDKIKSLKENEIKLKNYQEDLKIGNKTLTKQIEELKKENENLNATIVNMNKTLENFNKEKLNQIEMKRSNRDLNNMSFQSNDSFNEKNYRLNKNENNMLKDEIARLKGEITSLIQTNSNLERKVKDKGKGIKMSTEISFAIEGSTMNIKKEFLHKINDSQYDVGFLKSEANCANCFEIFNKINEMKSQVKPSTFKDLKHFYINYSMDIDKINTKIDDVFTRFSATEHQFSNENQDKMIKVSQVREIFIQVQKLLSLLSGFIGKYNKDVQYFTSNLRKILEFVSKLVYSNFISSNFSSFMNKSLPISQQFRPTIEIIIQMIYDINNNIFCTNEIKRIFTSYQDKSINEVINNFKYNCHHIKTGMTDINFQLETELSELDESFMKHYKPNDMSYKLVSDKIIRLKKNEFDFANMIEIVKNYFIVQEIVTKNLFGNSEETGCFDFHRNGIKSKVDVLERIYLILEDALTYKMEEMEVDMLFSKKMVLQLIKNQKAFILLSVDV